MDALGCLRTAALTVGVLYLSICFAKSEEGRTVISGISEKLCLHLCESYSACFRCQDNKRGFVCQTGQPEKRDGRQDQLKQIVNCSPVAVFVNRNGVYCSIRVPLDQTTKSSRGQILLASTTSLNWRLLILNSKRVRILKRFSQDVSQITYFSLSKKFFFVDRDQKLIGKLSINGRLEKVIKGNYLSIACSDDKLFAGTHSRKPQILTMSSNLDEIKVVTNLQYYPASIAVDLKRCHLFVGLLKTFHIYVFSFSGKNINKYMVLINTNTIMYIEPYGDHLYYPTHRFANIEILSLTTGNTKLLKLGVKVSGLCVHNKKVIALGLDGLLYLQENNQTIKIKISKTKVLGLWHCCLLADF